MKFLSLTYNMKKRYIVRFDSGTIKEGREKDTNLYKYAVDFVKNGTQDVNYQKSYARKFTLEEINKGKFLALKFDIIDIVTNKIVFSFKP